MTIRFRRQHALGLVDIRKLAKPWIRELEQRYALQSIVVKGKDADVVKFSRAGLDGEVVVAGDHIELSAQFGFLFAAFGPMIGAEIEKNLDAFMADVKRVTAGRAAVAAPAHAVPLAPASADVPAAPAAKARRTAAKRSRPRPG